MAGEQDKETLLSGSVSDIVDLSCDVCRSGLGIPFPWSGQLLG